MVRSQAAAVDGADPPSTRVVHVETNAGVVVVEASSVPLDITVPSVSFGDATAALYAVESANATAYASTIARVAKASTTVVAVAR